MKNDHLSIYLNDHLAGAVGAVEILERLTKVYHDQPLAVFCAQIQREVEADLGELRQIMKALTISESTVRQAGAWVAEKFSRVKLRLEGGSPGDFGLLLAFESLVVGIKGKEILWRALKAIKPEWPPLQTYDFGRLEKRAIEQGARVDEQRLLATREAFQPEET